MQMKIMLCRNEPCWILNHNIKFIGTIEKSLIIAHINITDRTQWSINPQWVFFVEYSAGTNKGKTK